MKYGIDIDGCLAQFCVPFHMKLVDMHGVRNQPVGYDPAMPPCWEWPRFFGYTYEEEMATWKEVWDGGTFWQYLPEEPYATQAITMLDRMAFDGHDIYYITHRRGHKVKQQTERWLEARGVYNPTVLIARGDKIPLFGALGLDAIVDDKLETTNAACSIPDLRVYAKDTLYNLSDRRHGVIGVASVLEMLKQEAQYLR